MVWLEKVATGLLLLAAAEAGALGGDFTLTADDGSTYSLSESRGRVVIISFGYTSCPDICPTALATIAQALRELGDDAGNVDPLFVSLDPERDTPEHLHEYTRFFHPRIRGLTGRPKVLKTVADQYRVRYMFVGRGAKTHYSMDHTASLYVVDAQGKLFGILPHGLPAEAVASSVRSAMSSIGAHGELAK